MNFQIQDTQMTNNNKHTLLLIIGLGIIACTFLYYMVDRELFYYGESRLPHGKILEYADVEHLHNKTTTFSNCIRLQNDGLPIIAKESVIRGYSNIIVDTIVSYGFNDSIIIVWFTSTEDTNYYFIDTPFTYNPTIMLADTIGDNPSEVFHTKKWVYNANCPPQWLFYIRTLSIVIFLLLSVGLVWRIKR